MQTYCFKYIEEKTTTRLRNTNFEGLCRQNVGFFDEKENATGALTADLATNATKVALLSGDSQARVFQAIFTLAAALVISFGFGSWLLSLIMLAITPFLLFGHVARMKQMQGGGLISDDLAIPGAHASEVLSNIRTVAALGIEKRSAEVFDELLEEPLQKGSKEAQINGVSLGFSSFIMMATYAFIFWFGAKKVNDGTIGFTEMMRTLMSIMMSIQIVSSASTFMGDAPKAFKAGSTIFAIRDRVAPIDSFSSDGFRPMKVEGRLEFKDISFRYPTRPEINVLKNYNLTIEAGQTVAFCGPSGGGAAGRPQHQGPEPELVAQSDRPGGSGAHAVHWHYCGEHRVRTGGAGAAAAAAEPTAAATGGGDRGGGQDAVALGQAVLRHLLGAQERAQDPGLRPRRGPARRAAAPGVHLQPARVLHVLPQVLAAAGQGLVRLPAQEKVGGRDHAHCDPHGQEARGQGRQEGVEQGLRVAQDELRHGLAQEAAHRALHHGHVLQPRHRCRRQEEGIPHARRHARRRGGHGGTGRVRPRAHPCRRQQARWTACQLGGRGDAAGPGVARRARHADRQAERRSAVYAPPRVAHQRRRVLVLELDGLDLPTQQEAPARGVRIRSGPELGPPGESAEWLAGLPHGHDALHDSTPALHRRGGPEGGLGASGAAQHDPQVVHVARRDGKVRHGSPGRARGAAKPVSLGRKRRTCAAD
ncbi:hypothetical protein ON010_g10151 [Phytophthora cinnamomi]|nr:hypothetical protein ON010_g10151 [Phytophthora cinnamomi]